MTIVFIIPFHVTRMEESIMPRSITGAYVSCYASGKTYTEATEKALQKLLSDGLHPKEVLQPIHELDISKWDEHKSKQWPDYIDSLPSQQELSELMFAGEVVYGPFGSYGQHHDES